MAKTNKQKNDRTVLSELPESVVNNLIKDCRNQGDFEDLMKQISKRLLYQLQYRSRCFIMCVT
jgi:hypothetical protein